MQKSVDTETWSSRFKMNIYMLLWIFKVNLVLQEGFLSSCTLHVMRPPLAGFLRTSSQHVSTWGSPAWCPFFLLQLCFPLCMLKSAVLTPWDGASSKSKSGGCWYPADAGDTSDETLKESVPLCFCHLSSRRLFLFTVNWFLSFPLVWWDIQEIHFLLKFPPRISRAHNWRILLLVTSSGTGWFLSDTLPLIRCAEELPLCYRQDDYTGLIILS